MQKIQKIKIRKDCARRCLEQAVKTHILEDLEHSIKLAKAVHLDARDLLKEAKELYHHEKVQRELMIAEAMKIDKNVWRYIMKDNRKKTENSANGVSNHKFRTCLPIRIKKTTQPILQRPEGFNAFKKRQEAQVCNMFCVCIWM